jgi:hypothetical protein
MEKRRLQEELDKYLRRTDLVFDEDLTGLADLSGLRRRVRQIREEFCTGT